MRATVGTVGVMGSLTLSCCGSWRNHVTKDDFTWSYVEEAAAGERANARLTGMRWEGSRKACTSVSQQEGEKKSLTVGEISNHIMSRSVQLFQVERQNSGRMREGSNKQLDARRNVLGC